MKKGFTLVELLVVVAIIGILLGIVGMASASAAKTARAHRAEAMAHALGHAITAFYSQNGRWPGKIETAANSGQSGDDGIVEITGVDADSVFQEVVKQSIGKDATRPLIDVSALFVARQGDIRNVNGCNDNHDDRNNKNTYCGNLNCARGVDFPEAIKVMDVDRMAFGWQTKKTGRFRRFSIHYNVKTDSVTVVQ